MRKPKFLSPSALNRWDENRTDYYLTYLAESRPPRIAQEMPAAVGSAFDAYCKSELYEAVYGRVQPPFDFATLYERQVEPHNRDVALSYGRYVFDEYKRCGAYDELLEIILDSESEPQFESKIEGTIDGVPICGHPDCRFIHRTGLHVILDWKVNGFFSKYTTSPAKYYRNIFTLKGREGSHRGYVAQDFRGVEISDKWLQESNIQWADQLSTYGWLLNEPVGDESVIMAVEQIVGKPAVPMPILRVAQFRARVSRDYQLNLMRRYKEVWTAIETGHIFTELSFEANEELKSSLERTARAAAADTDVGRFVNRLTRRR